MRNQEEYNFLKDFATEDVAYFRKIVIECVLATDLAKTMTWLSSARVAFTSNVGGVMSSSALSPSDYGITSSSALSPAELKKKEMEMKILKMQLVVKCADVGHPSRPLALHLEWSSRIRDEFFAQGDKERSKGMTISPLCDRSVPASTFPQGQLGFINFVSRPVFSLLSAVCSNEHEDESKPWLDNLESNVKYWEEEAAKCKPQVTSPS